jgi:hypothetical protein
VIPYFLAFWWINNMKQKYPYVPEASKYGSTANYSSMDQEDVSASNEKKLK